MLGGVVEYANGGLVIITFGGTKGIFIEYLLLFIIY